MPKLGKKYTHSRTYKENSFLKIKIIISGQEKSNGPGSMEFDIFV